MARHRSRPPQRRQRERAIQYVYARTAGGRRDDGQRHHLPRPQRCARDRQGAGVDAGQIDTLAKVMRAFECRIRRTRWSACAKWGCRARPQIRKFGDLWRRMQDMPRHLGQHSAMVTLPGPLDAVVPLEPAACRAASSCNGTRRTAPTWA